MGKLDGKVAVVTGASSGIGQASAVLFAREGARVVLAARNLAALNETVKRIKDEGGEAAAVQTDVRKVEDVKNMFTRTIGLYGQLDVLFNNAGRQNTGLPIHESSIEEWQDVINTNLLSVYLGMRFGIPYMLERGGGSIINTASPAGLRGIPFNSAYCASKGGVIQLTKAAAYEYAPYNIRVNCICPGGVDTPMLRKAWEGPDGEMQEPAGWLKRAPIDRLISPDELAPSVVYLACEDSSIATGSVLVVDGGFLAI